MPLMGSGLSPGGVQGAKPMTEKEFQHSIVCIILGHSPKTLSNDIIVSHAMILFVYVCRR